MHHGGYFTENPKTYVGGEVAVVDNCDPDKWSKVEIDGICRDFGYTFVSRLWYTMPGMDQEMSKFHLVVNDHDAMYMTELVKGHEEIHVYVEHPIDDPILVDEGKDVSESMQPLAVEQGLMGYYSDGSDDDDHDGGEFFSFYYSDDQTFNNEDEPTEVDANGQTFNADVAVSQMGSRRVGKEPIIEHPPHVVIISDGSDSGSGGSGLNDEVELDHGVRDFVEDSSDSWDGKDDDDDVVVEPGQMGAGVMNSDYESEKLHSLVESLSDDELGFDSDDDAEDDRSTHVGNGKGQKNQEVKKFPVFKPVV
ncbi:uncharacterized protein LOC111996006 [Quercus suber]|uniref:uncharacterized protein LOC111996006 n=1 Tax=Quercus suber TaxID=58331 RepID=UPI000CE1728C|nr:uncharacterized protein LOC111996006 [Quercus suber]XP_023883719.1 uncharacterized protein LOC111996006 [Quercus suber]